MHKWLALLCVSVALASSMATAAEQSPPKPAGARNTGKARKHTKSVSYLTPQREAAAIAFVRRHHAELATLLTHLKKAEAAEYRRAVTALSRTSEHLAQTRQRNAQLYQRELKQWKLKSRIQLLVAQARVAPQDEKLRRDLKQALIEQSDLRQAQLAEERKRLVDRLKKLEDQIKQTQKQRDAAIQKQLDLLLRTKKKRGTEEKGDRGRPRPPAKKHTP